MERINELLENVVPPLQRSVRRVAAQQKFPTQRLIVDVFLSQTEEQLQMGDERTRNDHEANDVTSLRAVSPVCVHCKGSGYLRNDVPVGHPQFGKAVLCRCRQARINEARRQVLRDLSGIDRLQAFQKMRFESFDTYVPGVQDAYTVAFAFAHQPQGWLVLAGINGCGKTHLAVAIARHCMDEGIAVRFAVVPDLLAELRETFAPSSETTYNEAFERMRQVELLVLDDFGAQNDTPWAEEELFKLLNYRYNAFLPTVITTNKVGFIGIEDRLRSRLNDRRLVRTITFPYAKDYRQEEPTS